jgi:hypothetical protein
MERSPAIQHYKRSYEKLTLTLIGNDYEEKREDLCFLW